MLVAGAALAQEDEEGEITVEGSNILKFDEGDEVDVTSRAAHPDNLIARHYIENRLRLDFYRGNLHVGSRLLYFRPSENDINQFGLQDESRIDKRFVEGTFNPLKLRFGHFSDLWGNGLSFASYENRELYFDSELDGVRAQLDAGPLTLVGMRGNSADGLLVKKSEISGTRLQFNGETGALGFSYVFNDSGYYPESHVTGLDLKYNQGMVGLNIERAWDETFGATSSSEGHGTYFNLTLSKWGWSLLSEYKDYDYTWERPFQNPPVVYREIGPRLLQGRDPHISTIRGEIGYQLELSGSPVGGTYASLHHHLVSRRPEHQGGVPRPTYQLKHSPYWEWFLNVEQTLPHGRNFIVELGINEEAAAAWLERQWVQGIFRTPYRDTQELEFEIEVMTLKDHLRDEESFLDQLYSIAWNSRRSLSLNTQLQLTDDEELKDREGDFWLSGEAAYSMGQGRHRMIVFYGRERGGLKCSNGVCRPVQAFEGLRITLETSL